MSRILTLVRFLSEKISAIVWIEKDLNMETIIVILSLI